ncbi:PTS sugar transporter subunit IIA [Yersinia intermedia]|uniref:PTS sugar transporter subunit IIA n=1 Tax=Yersinia intermedia TaxID=631 RepID=UPI002243F721|nr:PTS fructose transporter subunit IIA [Yersinia intermedia]MCW8114165.1 PTS fructose transporter subunit IIA [Yersinia intermedia]MDA5518943.1 PTS fructose transporter subunit IIA [Yersinia intermedia]
MREVFIASHGKYAEGIVSGLDLLIGNDHGITPVCAYCGDIGSTAELALRFDTLALEAASRGNEFVLFTDMQGGSVNNTAVQVMMSYPHMHVISGANLIMLMEFCMSEHSETVARIEDAIQMATHAMQYMNTVPEILAVRQNKIIPVNDDDDFFAVEGEV